MEVRETATKLHGAGPGEPCPPLPPVFVRVLSMRSYFVDFHRQCKQKTISQTTYSNLTNLAEILFKCHLVKESFKLKIGKRSLRHPGLNK